MTIQDIYKIQVAIPDALQVSVSAPGVKKATASLAGPYGAGGASIWYNVAAEYGADSSGVVDSTAEIRNAILAATTAGGGVVYMPAGSYKVSGQLNINSGSGVRIYGDPGSTYIKPTSAFAGSAVISVLGGNENGVENITIQWPNATYSLNPAADGIYAAHTDNIQINNVQVMYANGWALQVISDATGDSYYPVLEKVHPYNCAGGINVNGTASRDNLVGVYVANCMLDNCQVNPGLNLVDIWDAQVTNIDSSWNMAPVVRIAGTGGAVTMNNLDLGMAPTATAPSFLIEQSGGNDPYNIMVSDSLIQYGSQALKITAGVQIQFTNCTFQHANGTGVEVDNWVDQVVFNACVFTLNGVVAAPNNYDLNWNSVGNVIVNGCIFNTPIGSGAGQVKASSNFVSGSTGVVVANYFAHGQGTAYDTYPTFPVGNLGDTFTNLQAVLMNHFNTGGIGTGASTKTANYVCTINDSTIFGNAANGGFAVTLPPATDYNAQGRIFTFKKTDASSNVVTVNTTYSQTIDGASTYPLTKQNQYVTVQADGANWQIIGTSAPAAVAAGPSAVDYVPWNIGSNINPLSRAQSATTQPINYIVAYIMYSGPAPITISKMETQINSVGSASVLRCGLYKVTDQTNPFKWANGTKFGDLLVEAGTINTAAAGYGSVSFGTPYVIPANTWFVVAAAEQGTSPSTRVRGATTGASGYSSPLGPTNTGVVGYTSGFGISFYMSGVSGALPAALVPNAGLGTTDNGVAVYRSA